MKIRRHTEKPCVQCGTPTGMRRIIRDTPQHFKQYALCSEKCAIRFVAVNEMRAGDIGVVT